MGARDFTLDRMRQGFLTARHWDAFLAERDHAAGCADCGQPGEPMPLGDGSLQPTVRSCPEAMSLFHATSAIADSDRRRLARAREVVRRRRLRL